MAQRKLSLDAAVLGGLSFSAHADDSPAVESSAMSQLLANLLAAPAQPGSAQGAAASALHIAEPAGLESKTTLADAQQVILEQKGKAQVINLE